MLRYNFLDQISTVNDINIYDLLQVNWSEFIFKNGIKRVKLTEAQADRFYEFTLEYYGSYYNQDFILFINKIADPTDLYPGQEIILPDSQDISDFIFQQTGVRS